ncbi:MAG: serine/threonine protein kinase [Acidobacteria bacterium]|nr:serine/threonine protein kinase [Acidobacteriota bacterium]
MWLSDAAVEHLRAVAELPDFSGSRYRLLRELARGGMGVVYEAEDLELQRNVAVKVLATELTSGDFAERMCREARVIARLEHPGIVPLHDAGTLPDGRVFYAMKLVRGRRLDEVAATPPAEEDDDTANIAELLRLFVRVCEAVAFAHANGVVHCDLKPANVMVGEFGEVLVMDWGVARGLTDLPGGHVIAGTPGFMSPEQERGEPLDAATDVYALGAMLASILAQRAGAVPRRLAAIAAKAAAAVKADRYVDVGQLAADVVRYLDGRSLLAYRENAIERAGRWLSRNRPLVTIVLAYLVMRALVLLWVRR